MNDNRENTNHHFYDYYQKGNDSRRLTNILLLFSFFLCPLFAILFKYVGAPNSLFYSTLSATISFPVILFIEKTIPFFKGKLPILYFLFFNVVTAYSIYEMSLGGFSYKDFLYFISLFCVLNFGIQRFFLSFFYFINTLIFLIVGIFFLAPKTQFDPLSILTLFNCIGIFFLVIYFGRNKMINSVQDHNKYLKQIVNSLGNGIVFFQIRGNFITVVDFNLETSQLLKETSLEMIEEKFRDCILSEDIQKLIFLQEQETFTKEILLDGKTIEAKITQVRLKNGTYYLATLQDISMKIIENNLIKENEKKYKNLFIRNQSGVFTIDLDGNIIDSNPAFLEMFDRKGSGKVYLFEDKKEWKKIKENILRTGIITNYNKTYVDHIDRSFYFVFNFYFDYELQIIEGNVVDVTEITISTKALKENENKYRLIYEESNDSIVLLDDDRIININQQGLKLLGKTYEEIIEKSFWDFSYNQSPQLKKQYDSYFYKLKEDNHIKFNWIFAKNETFIEASLSIVALNIDGETFYQCVIRDETELNKNLRALENSKKTFESIVENTPEGFIILKNETCLYANNEFYRIFNLEKTEPQQIKFDEDMFGMNYPKFQKLIEEHSHDKLIKQKQLKFFIDQKAVEIDLTVVSIIFDNEEATLLILKDVSFQNKLSKEMLRAEIAEETNKRLAKEIEDRKIAELKLESEYLRTKAIFDSSQNTLLLTLTPAMKISSFNQQSKIYFDYQTKKELVKEMDFDQYFEQIISPIKLRYFRYLLSGLRKGKSYQLELKLINIYSEKKWLEIYLNPIFDVNNTLTEFSMVAHDITDKKKTEKEILLSLKEKEVLLKEVHHRVKNNLQIISSILNLQSSYIEDKKILEIIEESRHRIRSMAIIHENLYQNTNFSSINFKNYSRELVRNLISSYQFNKELNISLKEDIDLVELNLDQAIPCGLIINELITNTMKYAFANKKKGTIYLELKEKNNKITLVVGDDGVGLPANFDVNKTETLGLQLVVTLVEQLEGEIKLEKKKGIKYFITFEKQKL